MGKKYFNNFLRYAIMFVLILLFIYSAGYIGYNVYKSNSKLLIVVLAVFYAALIYFYKRYSSKLLNKVTLISHSKLLTYILVSAFILRLLWILVVPTVPASDFKLMYEYAKEASQGNYYGFHDYAYFARFTHDTITVLYFSLFYRITENPLLIVKFFNVIFQTASVYGIYLICKELFDKNRALISTLVIAFFPPFIMYTAQTMSENMAMPLYLFSVYFFIAVIKGKISSLYLLLCGLTLSFANMFRMVGTVFIIAYIMYTVIYKGFIKGLKNSILILIGFMVPFYLVSQALLSTNITETHLWKSKEPSITSILKGTNIKEHGKFNLEDAELPDKLNHDPEKIKEASKKIIVDRLTKTPAPKLVFHYIKKLAMQWGMGDFRAAAWTIENSNDTAMGKSLKYILYDICFLSQLIYLTILVRIFKAIKNNDYIDIEEANFFYILFGGFVLLLLITEFQERYAFIVSWLFVIFTTRISRASNYKVFPGESVKNNSNNKPVNY